MRKNTSQNSSISESEHEQYVGVGHIAELYREHPGKVLYQIKIGRLAAIPIIGGKGRLIAYAVKVSDAERLWGTAPKLIPANTAANAA